MYNLVLIPDGATLPEDLQHLFVTGNDIIEKVYAGAERQVIISVNTRELQMLVEYRDLFNAEPMAIIGMQGAMYNTVWNTYVATMERTTIDAFRATIREANDGLAKAGATAVARPDRSARVARLTSRPGDAAQADESDFSTD